MVVILTEKIALYYVLQIINFDDYTNANKTKHNLNWPYIPDHPYRILIIGGSRSGKTNALFNLINKQADIELNDNLFAC